MAHTASTMLALGTTAPDFSLPDVVSGKTITRDQAAGPRGLLVMFLCAHCPAMMRRLIRTMRHRGSAARLKSRVFNFPTSSMNRRRWLAPTMRPALRISFYSTQARSLSIEASSTAAGPETAWPWMVAICAPRWIKCWPVNRCRRSSSPALGATSSGKKKAKAGSPRRQEQ